MTVSVDSGPLRVVRYEVWALSVTATLGHRDFMEEIKIKRHRLSRFGQFCIYLVRVLRNTGLLRSSVFMIGEYD